MLEKVAIAIIGSRCADAERLWAAWSPATKQLYLNEARAAIEAMREPTEEMAQSAARGVSDSFHEEGFQEGDDPHLWNEFVKAGKLAFQNAIDAALSQQPNMPAGDKRE